MKIPKTILNLKQILDKHLNRRYSALSFGVYRVIFMSFYFIALNAMLQLQYFSIIEISIFDLLISIQVVLAFLMLIGLWVNKIRIPFFILNLLLINSYIGTISYGDIVITNINIVMLLLLPVSKTLSVDSVLDRSSSGLTTRSNYYFLLLSVSILYLTGGIFKITNELWTTKSEHFFEFFKYTELYSSESILNFFIMNPMITKLALTVTIIYQLLFIVVSFTRYKYLWFALGAALHTGVYVIYDVEYLTLVTLALYLPLIPPRYYYKAFALVRGKKHRKVCSVVYYDNGCLICRKYIYLVRLFDLKGRIKLKGRDLGDTNEIIIAVKGVEYRGVMGFTKLFETVWYFYPAYLLLKVTFIFDIADSLYKRIANNRQRTSQCVLKDNGATTRGVLLGQVLYLLVGIVMTAETITLVSSTDHKGLLSPMQTTVAARLGLIFPLSFFIREYNSERPRLSSFVFINKETKKELKIFQKDIFLVEEKYFRYILTTQLHQGYKVNKRILDRITLKYFGMKSDDVELVYKKPTEAQK